jgi:hypothetical protein
MVVDGHLHVPMHVPTQVPTDTKNGSHDPFVYLADIDLDKVPFVPYPEKEKKMSEAFRAWEGLKKEVRRLLKFGRK